MNQSHHFFPINIISKPNRINYSFCEHPSKGLKDWLKWTIIIIYSTLIHYINLFNFNSTRGKIKWKIINKSLDGSNKWTLSKFYFCLFQSSNSTRSLVAETVQLTHVNLAHVEHRNHLLIWILIVRKLFQERMQA
jgi:hypothetical protein